MKGLDCSQAERLIVELLDEGLGDATLRRLEIHLRGCPDCSAFREQVGGLLEALASDVPAPLGPDFWERYHTSLAARLPEREHVRGWGFTWAGVAAGIGAAIMFVAAIVGIHENEKPWGMDQRAAVELWQDLDQLYGPTLDEYTLGKNLGAQMIEALATTSRQNGDLPGYWFEVEDQSENLLL